MKHTKLLLVVALIAAADQARAQFAGAGAGAMAGGGFAGTGMFGPGFPFGPGGFPNVPQPPPLPWFGPVPFPVIPSPADIINLNPGPNSNLHGVGLVSSSNTIRDADGKRSTGGTVFFTDDNGELKVVNLGDNPPTVTTKSVELKPGVPFVANGLPNPWFGAVPFPFITNLRPGPNPYFNGVGLVSSSNTIRDADGKPITTGGTTIVTNADGDFKVLKLGDSQPSVTKLPVNSPNHPQSPPRPVDLPAEDVNVPAHNLPYPSDVAYLRSGPNTNVNGMVMTSGMTSGIGPDGGIEKTGRTTFLTNDNGEASERNFGDSNPSARRESVQSNQV